VTRNDDDDDDNNNNNNNNNADECDSLSLFQLLTLLLHILEATGSNPEPVTATLTKVFRGFLQSLQVNAGIVP
jgi:hypothetical protein